MHYVNGREAKVGDRVVGRCFNTKGAVAGTLVTLTPGQDACSAKVGFIALHTKLDGIALSRPVAFQGTEQHGSSGPRALAVYEEDYTEAKNLLHVDDLGDLAKYGLSTPAAS